MSARNYRRPPSLRLSRSRSSSDNSPNVSPNHSDQEDDDMSSNTSEFQSRPASLTMAAGAYCPRRPTLAEVLANKASPPFTLSAFMAYLSQNHCLETLEFTMDAKRYRKHYQSMTSSPGGSPVTPSDESCQYVKMLWQRLMDAYIQPNGPREVNVPGNIREELLGLPTTFLPPHPDSLDPAVNIIHELMEESILMPFLNSVSTEFKPQCPAPWEMDNNNAYMRGSLDERLLFRSRQSSGSPPAMDYASSYSSATSASRPGAPPFSPALGWHRHSAQPAASAWNGSNSGDSIVEEGSEGMVSPMTPPHTPPSCDSNSPKGKSHDTWRKMTGKLGWSKSRRSHLPPSLANRSSDSYSQ
ncbi:hypothetical protein DRE_04877 [Drechslerella stenobrocha 248]|uniref:RGS domain-containing protein n=1 Tax=Drechslerella stenobrocha 248 TaxID=1043628 RepID=W7I9Y9_9PEZI|nr:hypothetical protein DRE_04877 [Drechslerella stenobrocha 248]